MKPRIIAFTGMPMTGKSTARETMQAILDEHNIPQTYVHFGSTEEVERRNTAGEWSESEKNLSMEQKEKLLREQWRAEHGMGAMAIMKLPQIEKALSEGKIVLIDNLYSDEERTVLNEKFGEESTLLVATAADWNVRVDRGANRSYRKLTEEELRERDYSEVYHLHKSPPIALAKITIANNSNVLENLKKELEARVLPYLVA